MATAILGTGFLARNLDRRTARPAGIVYWLDDAPPALTAAGLCVAAHGDTVIYARASKFELAVNLKTAKALGIKVPNSNCWR